MKKNERNNSIGYKMHAWKALLIICATGVIRPSTTSATTEKFESKSQSMRIAKCCAEDELLVDDMCTLLTQTNETKLWQPEFIDPKKRLSIDRSHRNDGANKFSYQLDIGFPKCENNEHPWHVYYYPSGPDRLVILPSGKLRHYASDPTRETPEANGFYSTESFDDDDDDTESIHYDYSFGHYCADKVILSRDRLVARYAMVCVPEIAVRWTDTSYLMRHAIDPTFHAISITSYLIVAVIYFVLPQLRNLVGNMITSMTVCLITSQCASMVRIFTEFGSHVSFLIADTVIYVALLAAFFWLNAFGYYVWNTFRSRNVFLRVSDGKKYCYYSLYVWCSTICIAIMAIFAHFALETNKPIIGGSTFPAQETIGWLGMSVLFMCVGFTIVIDLCFILTTASRIKRMSTYGRIHHKMKYSFRMFVFLYAIMSVTWLFLLLSQLKYEPLVYCYIVMNLLQAILILYVCAIGQRRVMFLLGKTCNCCNSGENIEGLDWGEEMTAINAGY